MANNTEQPSGKTEQKKANPVAAPKVDKKNVPQEPKQKIEDKKTAEAKIEPKAIESKTEEKNSDKKQEKKVPVKKVSKQEVIVNAQSVPVSTKYAVSICKFIQGKEIKDARKYLEDVKDLKKSIPMKGEYAHKKGPGKMASGGGKYPVQASKHFINILKTLAGNATNHDILNPVISEAIANKASTPMGRFGRWKRKRTHITLKARELKIKPKNKKKVEDKK